MADPASTFKLTVKVPARRREEFFGWLWSRPNPGLLGVHEGTLLSDDAHRLGFETEPWIVDAGVTTSERDWIARLDGGDIEIYFESRISAEQARERIREGFPDWRPGEVEEQANQDWDAQWKASFRGVDVPPYWQVLPPWEKPSGRGRRVILLTPGAGFGTGTHETTQLCLDEIGELDSLWGSLRGARVIDFGSGSGILSIAAAICGAGCDAVEIDPLAHDNARHNAILNSLPGPEGNGIRFLEDLDQAAESAQLVIANILKPVLLEFAEALVSRLAAGRSALVLSGLVQADLSAVRDRYQALLSSGGYSLREKSRGEWRALLWRRTGNLLTL